MKSNPLVPAARVLLAAAAWLLLAGCQRTLFQNAPAAADRCDPDLVGHWLSQGESPDEHGELEAFVSSDCHLTVVEHKPTGDRRSGPTTLHNARAGGARYLWLDANWTNRSFEIEPNLLDHEGDIYLFAYSVRRDRLRLANAPHRAVAHRVLDKEIPGEVLMRENELTVRISGTSDEIRKTLGKHRIFRFDDALQFRRAPVEKLP